MRFKSLTTKVIGACAAVLLVAACETEQVETTSASGQGTATAQPAKPATMAKTMPAPSGPVAGSQEDLVLNVGDRTFFAYDKYDLSDEAQQTLRRQAAWMLANPAVTITVEGHCDERGTREYNLALGERRANSVKNMLVDLGVDQARVATISYGKERPEALGSNDAAWAQNRRSVSVVN